jgi:hypothetical protein
MSPFGSAANGHGQQDDDMAALLFMAAGAARFAQTRLIHKRVF